MAANNKTYSPAHSITIQAAEDLPAFRFISPEGLLCAAETKSAGITEVAWLASEYAAIVTLGTMVIETSGSVNLGEDVTSDTDGKAKSATAGMPVNGRALESCSGAGFIKINIVP